MHLPKLWNSLVGTSNYHLHNKIQDFKVKLTKYFFHFSDYSFVQHDCEWNVDGFPSGFLGLGEWQPYCKALETFLRRVAAHSILSKNKAVEIFLTSSDVSWHKYSFLLVFSIPFCFLRLTPVKRNNFMRQKGATWYIFTRETDNKWLNFHWHCFRRENERDSCDKYDTLQIYRGLKSNGCTCTLSASFCLWPLTITNGLLSSCELHTRKSPCEYPTYSSGSYKLTV